jgi:dTDP-glucose 4,6-dehydratase
MIDLSGKTILISGGLGFIGSNFIEYIFFKYSDLTVINIDKMGVGARKLNLPIYTRSGLATGDIKSYVQLNNNNKYYEIIEDIATMHDKYQVDWVFNSSKIQKIDYVFHFAAESHVDRSINSPYGFIHNNVMGTTGLLEFLRQYQPQARIIEINTDEIYGHLGKYDLPFTENSPIAPRSPYSASKASATLIAQSFHETYGMDILTTRCCNNYGKHQHDEKFIPTVIRSLVEGKKIPVYGTGENVREWIHVEDHNKAILRLAEIGDSGGVYNVGSGVEKTNLEIIRTILDIFHGHGKNIEDYVEFVEDRKGHDFRYAIKSVKWVNDLKQRSFEDGMKETVEFYKEKYER